MIKSFRSKSLRRFYEEGITKGLNYEHLDKIRMILARLDCSDCPNDLSLPGLRLHQLKGNYGGFYAVTVSANWRIVFRFVGKDVYEVEYVDYH